MAHDGSRYTLASSLELVEGELETLNLSSSSTPPQPRPAQDVRKAGQEWRHMVLDGNQSKQEPSNIEDSSIHTENGLCTDERRPSESKYRQDTPQEHWTDAQWEPASSAERILLTPPSSAYGPGLITNAHG